MIAIIDYDAGNIKSVEKALLYIGEEPVTTRDPNIIYRANKVILPGVGSFGDAMDKLKRYDLIRVLKDVANQGIPLLGICLGLQLLFEESEECPEVKGLSILSGKIMRIPPKSELKIPHMGWNSLNIRSGTRLFDGMGKNPYVYFVHSYYLHAQNPEDVAATADFSTCIHAAVERNNIFACQFHPEKSSKDGLTILKNFAVI